MEKINSEEELKRYHRLQAKHYLSIVRGMQLKIEVMCDEIASLRETMTIGSPSLEGMPRNPNPSTDAVLNAVLAVDERCDKLSERVKEYRRVTMEADDIIASLTSHPLASVVINYYYLQGWSWKAIASKVNLSMAHLKSYVVNQALDEIYHKMPPKYRDEIPSAM